MPQAGDILREYWLSTYNHQVPLALLDEWNELYGEMEKTNGPHYKRMLAMEAAKLSHNWRTENLAASLMKSARKQGLWNDETTRLLKEIKADVHRPAWLKFAGSYSVAVAATAVLAISCVLLGIFIGRSSKEFSYRHEALASQERIAVAEANAKKMEAEIRLEKMRNMERREERKAEEDKREKDWLRYETAMRQLNEDLLSCKGGKIENGICKGLTWTVVKKPKIEPGK